ncbi:MAG: hypothetical protein HC850_12175 [Rhodomicrobium sp.]|nr:hypothetical protein [Rhodomicrobium sp.]
MRVLNAISILAERGAKIYISSGNNFQASDEAEKINIFSLAVSDRYNKSQNINVVTGTKDIQGEPSTGAEHYEVENQLVTDRAPSFIRFLKTQEGYVGYNGGLIEPDSINGAPEEFLVKGGSSSAAPYELGQDVKRDFFQ